MKSQSKACPVQSTICVRRLQRRRRAGRLGPASGDRLGRLRLDPAKPHSGPSHGTGGLEGKGPGLPTRTHAAQTASSWPGVLGLVFGAAADSAVGLRQRPRRRGRAGLLPPRRAPAAPPFKGRGERAAGPAGTLGPGGSESRWVAVALIHLLQAPHLVARRMAEQRISITRSVLLRYTLYSTSCSIHGIILSIWYGPPLLVTSSAPSLLRFSLSPPWVLTSPLRPTRTAPH